MHERYADWAARWRVPAGFLLAAAYVVLAQPRPGLLAAGGFLALFGLLLRAYAAGCLLKNQQLATGGPYSRTRNPLYLGSLLIGIGFAVAGGVWYLGAALLGLFVLIYWPVMRREEAFLRAQFGADYARYAAAVPFFFPSLRRARFGGNGFCWERYVANREYQAAFGFAAGLAFLLAKMMLR